MPIYEYSCDTCGDKHLTQEYSTFAARASGASGADMPSCGSGMCGMPGLCGRN